MSDDVSRYNRDRWRRLAQADALFTRPQLDLTPESAAALVGAADFGDIAGKRVLCLAGGGGRQSAAYGLLGADVTVFDLAPEQLDRDRQVAAHYDLHIEIVQGDMRDLSALQAAHYDVVDHPYALNFVPEARVVFQQVARVIKPGGFYRVMCANPFAAGITERAWNGDGYILRQPYEQGRRYTYPDQPWVYKREDGDAIPPPQEFQHTLSTLINGLVENGLQIQSLHEAGAYMAAADAEPGTWDHLSAVLPPWLFILTRKHSDM